MYVFFLIIVIAQLPTMVFVGSWLPLYLPRPQQVAIEVRAPLIQTGMDLQLHHWQSDVMGLV